MLPHGSDRVRTVGEKTILFSRNSKGWTPRAPKTNTTSEHPGTAVLWDDQYFEVVAADVVGTGVRYVLEPWREEHVFRVVDHYDAESEARRADDWQKAAVQRKRSVGTSLLSILLGHLPAAEQNRLSNEYGVSPARMTIASCFGCLVLLGVCVWFEAKSRLGEATAIPVWLWFVAGFLSIESAVRFHVAMSQDRGMGSMIGWVGYALYWLITPKRANLTTPLEAPRGQSIYVTEAPEDVALQDALQMRGPLFTLLTTAEQQSLAERYGFDYRSHATGLAIIILASALLGVISSVMTLSHDVTLGALTSLLVAGPLAVEQVLRLRAFSHGPAGSMLGPFVRPFVRSYLG